MISHCYYRANASLACLKVLNGILNSDVLTGYGFYFRKSTKYVFNHSNVPDIILLCIIEYEKNNCDNPVCSGHPVPFCE